ncbi:HAD-IB family hydrolase [Aquamicrobium sp. NLF2-7]|uniref:HAD family hydrolase n=1 Tax=Aquamicrobium sp. NLF2-7 TaxID=2918753 RepID=UPI001EFC0DAF|nr:HAD family hydrolase [Aquamicrobium sp. NLF2-7]MCG8273902.1 HAD-IB family hydrolase [Aquamicrobium sp. NLF2-7]
MARKNKCIAFFDVDETLIATKSMFDFLGFLGDREAAIDGAAITAEMQRLNKEGVDRASINVRFWRHFSGLRSATVQSLAREWFAERQGKSSRFYIPSGLDRLEFHRSRDDVIAFVSGSACVILEPVARQLGAEYILATRLVENDGIYNGEILPPVMIGVGKQVAAQQLARSLNINLADCHAYGDHWTDLPLLEAVGHSTAIGMTGELANIARARGWSVLPGLEEFKREGAAA